MAQQISRRELRFSELEASPFREFSSDLTTRSRINSIKEIFSNRELLALLVRRDIKARYKDSALGMAWVLVRPIAQLLIFYVVIGQFLGAARGIPDFAIYVYAGLAAYGLFSEIVSGATQSIVQNGGLVKKVYLPREIFPIASVGSALFNFLIQIGVLLALIIFTGKFEFGWNLFHLFPAIFIIVLYGVAFGIALSALNVYLRDIGHLVEVILMLLMWASPVVYSWTMVKAFFGEGLMLNLYSSNPVTLGVMNMQLAFWPSASETNYPDNLSMLYLISSVVGLLLLVLAQGIFRRLQGSLAQEL